MGNFLTIQEVAKLLGVHKNTVDKLCAEGQIKFFQVKKWSRKKFKQEWVDDFINQKTKLTQVEIRAAQAPQPKTEKVVFQTNKKSKWGFF